MANKFALTAQMVLTPPKNLGQVASQIQNQFKGVNANFDIKANPQQMAQITDGLKSISVESKKAKKEYSALADVIGAGARRFAAITLVTSTFIGLTRSIKRSLGDAIEFERKLTTLSQVTGKTVGQLGDLRDEINRISKAFGVSSDGLLDTATTLSQAGYTARQVKDSLEVLAKSELAASFDNVQNTTEGAIAILSQFRREAAKAGGEVKFLEQSLGAINDVSKAYAVESADLITAIRQTGGSFEAAGGSLNELLGVFTSVRATTRESAETIATGLRTIFTRIQRVDTINALKQLGVELQDVEGKFVGPFEAIQRISKGLSSIDTRDIRFASIVEELGGFRQIGKVIPLIKQQKLGVEALSTALRANDSLTQDAAIAQTSLANRISVVREEFQDLVRNFQDSKSFKNFVDLGLNLAKAFIGVAASLEKLLPLLGTFAAVQLGRGAAEVALGGLGLLSRKKPIKRNTGGGVPGTGTGDKVPAFLEPGEFVMRRTSVESIGVNNMAKMNVTGELPNSDNGVQYFSEGGEVSFSPKRNKFGGFFLNPFGGGNTTIDTDSKGLLLDPKKRSVRAILERFNGLSTKFTAPQDEETTQSNPISVLSELPYVKGEKKKNGVLTSEAYKPIYPFVNQASKEFKQKNPSISITNDTSDKTKYYKGIIYENAVQLARQAGIQPPLSNQNATSVKYDGKEFALSKEAVAIKSHFDARVINALAGEAISTKQKVSEPSVISGIQVDNEKFRNSTPIRIIAQKKVPALFPSGEGVKEGYQEDVKKSVTDGVEGMIGQFSKNIIKDVGPFTLDKTKIRESSLALLKDQSALGSISGYIFEGVIAAITGAKAEGQGATFDFLTKDKTSVFTKLFQNVPKDMEAADAKATKESGQNILTQKIPAFLASVGKENMSNYLDNISYFNTGGFAKGKDTIPAMLEAGEFVFSTRAVEKIGVNKLNQMNDTPQYFSRGGIVNKRNNMSTKEKELADASSINTMYQGSSYAAGASNKDNIKIKFASEKASKEFIELSNELVKIKASGQEVSVAFKVFARELTKGTSAKDAKDFAIQSTYSSGPNTPSGRLRSVTPTRSVDQGAGEIRQAGTFNLNQNQVAQSLSTVVGNKDLPKAMSAYVREIQRGGTEQQAMNEAVIAGERAQRDRINKEFRTKENTERGKSLQASKDYGSGPPSSPPSSPLTPEQAAQNAAISAQNTTNADEKISKFVQSVGSAAFTFGFLATSISSVISQYGFLDDAMAESVSRVTTTFATVFATGQTLVGFLSNLKNATIANVISQNAETNANIAATASENAETVANVKSGASSIAGLGAASAMSKVTLGLTGVVAGVAAGMAIAEYYSTQYSQAQEKANVGIKEFTKELETNGKGDASQLAALQKESLTNEAKATGASSGGLKGALAGGIALAGAGAVIGSFAGPIGTVIGATAGGVIGGVIGGFGGSKLGSNNASLSQTSIKSIEESSKAQVGATGAIYAFQKSVELAELANLGSSDKLFKVNASTEDFVKSYKAAEDSFIKSQELRVLDSLQRGGPLTQEQEKQKLADETVLQNLNEQAKKVEDTQRKLISDASENLINRGSSKEDIFKTLKPSIENFKKIIEETRPEKDAALILNSFIKGISDASEANDKLRTSQEAISKAFNAQRDAILAVNSGLKALAKISDIENGIENSLSNFISSLDGGAASFRLSLSSGFADITNVPDQDSFAKDVNSVVGIIGPQARKLGDSVINASSIFQKAESVLLNKNLAALEGVEGEGDFESSVKNVADKIFEDIGIDPLQLGEMGTIIKENLKKAIIDKKGGGYIDKTVIREIFGPFIDQGQDAAKLFSGLIEQQQRKVVQHGQLIDKLNELSRSEVEIRQGIVDSQERLFNNVASVDPNITPEQKQVQNQRFRDARAGASSARFGVRNPNDVGAILSKVLGNKEKLAQLRKEAALNTTSATRLQFLNKTITDLSGQTLDATNRLKELSNQSDKTADILAKLDKIRAGKDQIKSKADSFIFGSDEERADIQRSFEYLNQAMRQGNLAGFDDDQRKAIGSLLSDLGDTKIGRNGENGNDIRSMLSVNEAVRNGADRGTAQAVFGKDLISSEQAIIQELNAVSQAEIVASNALGIINQENINAVLANTQAIVEQTQLMGRILGDKIEGNSPINLSGKKSFNDGGVVGGGGVKISRPGGDNRLVTMNDKEFVVTEEGRRLVGDDFLYSLNDNTLPGFATGSERRGSSIKIKKDEDEIFNPSGAIGRMTERQLKLPYNARKVKELESPISEDQLNSELIAKYSNEEKERKKDLERKLYPDIYGPRGNKPKSILPKAIPQKSTQTKSLDRMMNEMDIRNNSPENIEFGDKGKAFTIPRGETIREKRAKRSGVGRDPDPSRRPSTYKATDNSIARDALYTKEKERMDKRAKSIKGYEGKPVGTTSRPVSFSSVSNEDAENKINSLSKASSDSSKSFRESLPSRLSTADPVVAQNVPAPIVSSPISNSIGSMGRDKNNPIGGSAGRRKARISASKEALGAAKGIFTDVSPRDAMLANNRKSAEAAKAQKVQEYKAQQAVRLGGSDTFNAKTNKFTTTNKNGDVIGSRDATPQQLEQRKQVQAQQAQQGQNGVQGANGQQPVINFAEGAKTLQDALNASLNRIPELFKTTNDSIATFVTALQGIATTFNGMKMEHTVTVGGAVSLTGMNLEGVSEAITQSVASSIKGMVGKMMDEKLKEFRPS